ncbi:hemerythrin family protein [Caenispirillum bisanense]|uniref:bacteriohemerythrin n=1 Tax=Caenispirillum bisanense TaxID=414052 RepID=UPI0031DB7C05
MALIWRDQMAVGHPVIDDDHRALIAIINDFEAEAERGAGVEALSTTLRRLHAYARDHFAREEAVQARIGFPFHDAHAQEHRRLLAVVEEKARGWFVTRTEPVTEQSLEEMAAMLRRWLVDHILRQDAGMRPYIKAARIARKTAPPPAP